MGTEIELSLIDEHFYDFKNPFKMSHTRKTTEFSTHISRSRMRRYLHGQLDAKETRQVELHLANCAHCSASLVNYIETEEAAQYNTYAKQLAGKLKEQKIAKRPVLSSFQARALRASAAVVALLIFSFFGVKTIINKDVNNYQADAETTSVANKVAVATKKPVEKKVATKPVEKKADERLAENRPVKAETSRKTTKKATPVKKTEITKKKVANFKPANQPVAKKEVKKPIQKKAEEAKPEASVPSETKKVEKQAEPTENMAKVEEKTVPAKIEKATTGTISQETAQEEPAPVKTIPVVKKMDASKKVEITKPVGSTTPQVAPIPGGRLR